MSASVAWLLATRYLKTRRKQFAAFITWVSLAGLTLGVLVLTVVVSVMNGFDRELKTRILGTVPHILLPGLTMADPRTPEVLAVDGVASGYDFFVGAGMLTHNGAVNPVSVYGLDPGDPRARAAFSGDMVEGDLADLAGPGHEIVLGAPLAARLGLIPGDSVVLIVSEPGPGGVQPRLEPYRLVGTFEIGAELDYMLAVMALEDFPVSDLSTVGSAGVRLTLTDPLLVQRVARALESRFPGMSVETWADNYGELFSAVRLEKVLMFLILLMVVAVAAFNIVSGQMMVVTDKRSDIAILRTMGAEGGTILQAFLYQGLLISGAGIIVGLLSGVLVAQRISDIVAWMKDWFGFGLLDGTYFVKVPVLVQGGDLVIIAALSGLLCLFSAWLPARRAARLNPIEGLHY
ncbi:MAG: FtsX-like permease family protein [Pseudomonadales bacterium]|jgi:lipoprotein-releasing system permease protein